MKDIKNIVKSKTWVWFWSGNWPMLDNIYDTSPEFQDLFKGLSGTYLKNAACFFKDGVATIYHAKEDYEEMEQQFLKNFKENPRWILNSFKNYKKQTDKDLEALKKIGQRNFKNMQSSDLASTYIETLKHFTFNAVYDHFNMYIEKFFVPILENYLKKRLKELGEEEKLPYHLNLLLTPQKESRLFKERQEFFSLVKKVQSNFKWKQDVLENKEGEVQKLIAMHAKKHGYLTILVNNPPTTKEQYTEEIKNYLSNNQSFKIESVRLGDIFDKKTKKEVKKLIKKLRPSKRIKLLIKGLRETAFCRTEDNAVMSLSTYYIMPMQKEITKRLGISYYDLKELVREEIIFFTRFKQKVSKKLIEDRLRLTLYISADKDRYLSTEKEAKWAWNHIHSKTKIDKTAELKGMPASIGKATGTAFVAKSSNQLKDFEKGGILIAPATSADFVPVMRKAGAIVTEMGGITSHAGIVSREFNVPCIVGVKHATSILKTGDKIEVDAHKGIIKKLKS
ncbi:MAG: PEP-utilizing enzyme [archaeon]